METKELVKGCEYVTKEENDDELRHRQRVAKVIGVADEWEDDLGQRIQSLKTAGFRMFVKKDKVFKDFAYHAGIGGSYTKTTGHDWGAVVITVLTVGIIFAAAILGAKVGGGWWFLLAALAFPLSGIGIFTGLNRQAIDYVGDIPEFALDNMDKIEELGGFPRYTIHSANPLPTVARMVKVDPVMICWLDSEVGVVVAMWDMDKEIDF